MTNVIPQIITAPSVNFDAASLKAALASIKPAFATKHRSPGLACVKVTADADGGVTITGTDLDVTLTAKVHGAVTLDCFDGLVPFAKLDKALAVFKTGEVEVTFGDNVEISSGKASVSAPAVSIEDFPKLNPVLDGLYAEVDLGAVAEVLGAVSKDDTRPILTSVCIDNGTYVTTDSYRLHLVETNKPNGVKCLISRPAAAIMAKYDGIVWAKVSEREIRVDLTSDLSLHSRLVDGEFPDFRRLIPTGAQSGCRFTESFAADLAMLLKLFGSATTNEPVRLSPHDDGIEMTISDGATVTTVITPGTALLQVAFTPRYLLDGLKGLTSTMRLECVDHLKPAVLREPAPEFGPGAERLRLLMPVRCS